MTTHAVLDAAPSTPPALRTLRWSDPAMTDGGVPGSLALPAGTVTFLLTDIEGSTLHWQAAPGPMAAAVARHYELLDEAIAAHGGVRPEEQGEGDSVVAAFSRASDALAAALHAQQLLTLEPWPTPEPVKVRMAVHTGEAQLRDEANYIGMAIIRTARLRNIAHGGQVLVSSASRDLALDQVGDGLELVDLGEHRLKDLARPERVYQLAHADLPATFEPLRSLDAVPNNLPIRLSTFIGRHAELEALNGLLTGNRLVTVTGSGGAGKTRLALQASAEITDRFPDGVWWVELAPLPTDGDVGAATAAAIGVSDDSTTPIADLIARRLAADTALVVLDNCEHVVGPAADLAAALLAACPGVRILATSRTVLDVDGEVTWRVPPLSLPTTAEPVPIDRLGQFDAVRLFVDRARRARPTFALSDDNGPAVADICARLDGIPLAIELAAARTKSLSPERIRDGLDDSLRLLTGGTRAALPRQQTLEASISWSVALLAERERMLLRRLSAFAGGFDLTSAEQVCAGDGLDELEVLDGLERLLDHSLIVASDGPGEARFVMLETVRQFGARLLDEAEESSAVRERHARHFSALAMRESPQAETDREIEIVARLDAEGDNLRVALTWVEANESPTAFAELVCALAPYWDQGGHFGLAIDWFSRTLDALPDRDSALRALILAHRAEARQAVADFVGLLADVESSLAMGERVQDDRAIGRALWTKASMLGFFDLSAYRPVVEQAIPHLTAAGDRYAAAEIRQWRGSVLLARGLVTEAIAALDDAEPYVEAVGNRSMLASYRTWRAWTLINIGQVDAARRLTEVAEAAYGEGALTNTLLNVRLQTSFLLEIDDDARWNELEDRLVTARRTGAGLHAFTYGVSLLALRNQRGETDEAMVLVDELDASPALMSPLLAMLSAPEVVHALLLAGRRDQAMARIEATEATATTDGSPYGLGMMAWLRSVLLSDEGEVDAAEAAAHASIANLWDNGAIALVRYGLMALILTFAASGDHAGVARLFGVLGRIDDELDIRVRIRILAERLDVATERAVEVLGAEQYQMHVAEAAGLDLAGAIAYVQRTRGERRRPAHGWDSLTPTELQVIDLVRQGMTNKDVAAQLLMGAETVKTHLSHIFTKLGVNNRAKLTALATERTQADPQ